MVTIINQKYEITDIAHEKYSYLHRIRALRNVGKAVKAGDLGGFVENERNLAFEPWDDSWIFDDAIAAEGGHVNKGACLRERAVVCGQAYVTYDAELTGNSRAEDDAIIRNASLNQNARVSGFGVITQSPVTRNAPVLSGNCAVYGKVSGDVILAGNVVIASGEAITNDSLDTLSIDNNSRTIIRDPSRDELAPTTPQFEERKKPKRRDVER